MSDVEIRAAWRRWRLEPSAENAITWARLQDRTQDLGPSVADAFGVKDVWGKRVVRIVSKAMVLLHGLTPPPLAELSLSDVAKLSRRQWLDLGDCGPVTLDEIRVVLEAHGLSISEKDDEIVDARQITRTLERAVAVANTNTQHELVTRLREERDELTAELVVARAERDAARAAFRAASSPPASSRPAAALSSG